MNKLTIKDEKKIPSLSKINALFKMRIFSNYIVSLDEYSSMFLKVLV